MPSLLPQQYEVQSMLCRIWSRTCDRPNRVEPSTESAVSIAMRNLMERFASVTKARYPPTPSFLSHQEGGMRSPPRCSGLGRLSSRCTTVSLKPNIIPEVVPQGEASVLIAVASEHRPEAGFPGRLHIAAYSERWEQR